MHTLTKLNGMSEITTPTAGNEYSAEKIPHSTLLEIIRIQTKIMQMGLDLSGIIAFIADEVQRLTNSAGAIVELVEQNEMIYRAATGIAKPHLGFRHVKDLSLSGICLASGNIMICNDLETDDQATIPRRKIDLQSIIVAPLVHENNVVGVLKVVAPEPHYFNATHITILETMSELIAAAMYYSSKYELGDLHFRATHDVMTGLANRALFYDHLHQCFSMASRHQEIFGVLNIDMDGLKAINDKYGHRVGDAAIMELAGRIKNSARDSDTVARLGGDEFGILLSRVEGRKGAELVMARISEEIHRPFIFENRKINLRASIGIAIYPEDASTIDDIIEKADQAMYRSKRTRKMLQRLH